MLPLKLSPLTRALVHAESAGPRDDGPMAAAALARRSPIALQDHEAVATASANFTIPKSLVQEALQPPDEAEDDQTPKL